ncbi:MAG: ACP S-malonyltransferase [Holophagaceae bacterium]|nr:ACP S-malonyltransferase [Holophagaceae bacterium]
MTPTAPILVFPGQATESIGMSGGWDSNPEWNETMAKAEASTGYALRGWMSHGPLEALRAQRHAPCVVLAHSVALYRAQRAAGMPLPAGASGHSMGFFSAIVAAEVVPLEATLELIRATEDCAEARFSAGQMGMAFVIGIEESRIRAELELHLDLLLSNINGKAQFTVSGPQIALHEFISEVTPHSLKCGLLPVRHPLHCDHMAPLIPYIKARLEAWAPNNPSFPLVSPLDGRILDGGFEAWEETIVSIASAVNWPMAVMGLKGLGTNFFECGFGSQLKNLTGWIDRGLNVGSLQAHLWDPGLGTQGLGLEPAAAPSN